nr:hypothetical protein [Mycobacterium botniense]
MATTAAVLQFLAPPVSASPESDAGEAITAAWEQAGGEHSVLGAQRGDVYPVGGGFAQNFAGGKIFFTPATGARILYGAVLDKYESLGGPAGSDLGFPTINEVPGLVGPDTRVSTFSAPDKPVIFWSPEHGAFVVRGAINTAWDKLGSSGGVLGVPVGDELYEGELATQPFSGGRVSWNRVTKTFATVPPELAGQLAGLPVPIDPTAAINIAWRSAGGPGGPLGAKKGGQYPIGRDGIGQNFAGGKVFFSPATGANAVEGAILAKYESLGGPLGSNLGYPVANEADGGIKPVSRVSVFSAPDRPVIFWTPEHGAFVVQGAMKAAWDKLGGATGTLGAPVGDPALDGDVVSQKFAGGTIAWDRVKNTFSTRPPNLAALLRGLQVPGQHMPSRSATTAHSSQVLHWHWWWLVAVIVVLLAVVMTLAGFRWRQRRSAGPGTTVGEAEQGGHTAEPADTQWSPAEGRRVAVTSLGPRYSERSRGSPPTHAPDPFARDSTWIPDASGPVSAARAVPTASESLRAPAGFDAAGEDPDAVDTAPTRVPTATEVRSGRHAAVETAADAGPRTPAAPARLAIHLPLEDPYQAPDGYPVKANTSSGLYYTPESELYEETLAEIWLASEEVARANGFIKAG